MGTTSAPAMMDGTRTPNCPEPKQRMLTQRTEK